MWLYVVALYLSDEDENDGTISFEHLVVRAGTESDAYANGQHAYCLPQEARMLNDYVVDLLDALKRSI